MKIKTKNRNRKTNQKTLKTIFAVGLSLVFYSSIQAAEPFDRNGASRRDSNANKLLGRPTRQQVRVILAPPRNHAQDRDGITKTITATKRLNFRTKEGRVELEAGARLRKNDDGTYSIEPETLGKANFSADAVCIPKGTGIYKTVFEISGTGRVDIISSIESTFPGRKKGAEDIELALLYNGLIPISSKNGDPETYLSTTRTIEQEPAQNDPFMLADRFKSIASIIERRAQYAIRSAAIEMVQRAVEDAKTKAVREFFNLTRPRY